MSPSEWWRISVLHVGGAEGSEAPVARTEGRRQLYHEVAPIDIGLLAQIQPRTGSKTRTKEDQSHIAGWVVDQSRLCVRRDSAPTRAKIKITINMLELKN